MQSRLSGIHPLCCQYKQEITQLSATLSLPHNIQNPNLEAVSWWDKRSKMQLEHRVVLTYAPARIY
jgi:hypothetical protein